MNSIPKRSDGAYDLPFGPDHIGAELLEIISGALYTNPFHIIREYVQNAVDAQATDICIEIRDDCVLITDNGCGMDIQALNDARRIAISRKRNLSYVGFRGIGIYSSFSVCDRMDIVTKSSPEEVALHLSCDYHGIRSQLERARSGEDVPTSIQDVMNRYMEIRDATNDLIPAGTPETFTCVRLSGTVSSFLERLQDGHELDQYLAVTVPLDFSDEFEHAEVIREAVAKNVPYLKLARVLVRIGDEERLVVQPAVSGLLRPALRLLHDPESGEAIAFVWACLNRERRALKSEESRGFLLRVRGFTIGDRKYALRHELWGSRGHGALYDWYTGEIYVLDPAIRPTAARDNLEESPATRRLHTLIHDELVRLERLADRRRAILVDIEKVGKGKLGLSQLPRQIGSARTVGKELWMMAELPDSRDVLDEKGARLASVVGDDALPPTASSTAVEPSQQESFVPRNSSVAPQPVDEGEGETIAQILLSYPVQWTDDAQEVIEIVDETLIEFIKGPVYRQCATAIRNKLDTLERSDDL